jgi:hypothetical protein
MNKRLKKGNQFKVGPMDLLWDEKLGVWTCHDTRNITLDDNIFPAEEGTGIDFLRDSFLEDGRNERVTITNNLDRALPLGGNVIIGYIAAENRYEIVSTRCSQCTSSIFGITVTQGYQSLEKWDVKLNDTIIGVANSGKDLLLMTDLSAPYKLFGNYIPPIPTFDINLMKPSGVINKFELAYVASSSTGSKPTVKISGIGNSLTAKDNWEFCTTLLNKTMDSVAGTSYTFYFMGPYP